MLTTKKGSIAEAAIVCAAAKLGIHVLKPLTDGCRYDLIFDVDRRLIRVQCKWAPRDDDVVIVRCFSSRRNRDGLVRRCYDVDEVDAFAAYCAELDRCYFLPFRRFPGRLAIQLRLKPTGNNQKLGVNWAEEFEFERLDWNGFGAVAQLGERLAGSQ